MAWEIVFYESRSGNKPVKEFLDSLEGIVRNKVYSSLELLKEYGINLSLPHVKKITGTPLWELRILGESSTRIFYVARAGQKFLLLHGFRKKSQKTPENEIKTAEKRLNDFITKL